MSKGEGEMVSVGAILREAREKKKITIEDAARATKIKNDLIEALENDDYEKLPSPTYVKGFLKIFNIRQPEGCQVISFSAPLNQVLNCLLGL